MRSIDPYGKCGAEKTAQRAVPDCGFSAPVAPKGAEHIPSVMCRLFLDDVISYFDSRLKSVPWIVYENHVGDIAMTAGAIAGNSVYAWRRSCFVNKLAETFYDCQRKVYHVVLTKAYDKTREGIVDSWRYFQRELPCAVRKLKAYGLTEYIAVKEAHADGGCHAHLLVKGDDLTLSKLNEAMEAVWNGSVHITPVEDFHAFYYVMKNFALTGHVEKALVRAKRNWREGDDYVYRDYDMKLLWTYYFCGTLKMRLLSRSKNLRVTGDVQEKNVSTYSLDIIKGKRMRKVIPPDVVASSLFSPVMGVVERGTVFYDIIKNILYDTT
jgi:hypothetical protein